jgi:hypothetical protein
MMLGMGLSQKQKDKMAADDAAIFLRNAGRRGDHFYFQNGTTLLLHFTSDGSWCQNVRRRLF